MKKIIIILLSSLLLILPIIPASATTYTYDFTTFSGPIASPQTVTVLGIPLIVTGYVIPGGVNDLYGTAQGLGLQSGVSNSISDLVDNYWIEVNISPFDVSGNMIVVTLAGLSGTNSYKIVGSNTEGVIGTLGNSGSFGPSASILLNASIDGFPYLDIVANSSSTRMFLGQIEITGSVVAPEPGTLLILGSGLALAAFRKRLIPA